MSKKISVVINTFNEEKNIARAIKSVKWSDEILLCDMHSTDNTVEIAQGLGAKVVFHEKLEFVEPARNFAISKATGDWILILDADEEIPAGLEEKIKELLIKPIVSDYVEIPRKNIIFGHWMKASMWWPDYHIRLFKKNKIVWQNKIHSKPKTSGQGLTLAAEENLAIIHYNYQTVSQFIERLNRYSDIQSKELQENGVIFEWRDLIKKPLDEFLSRFFAKQGYLDGVFGLGLSLLQAFSFLVVYLKLWEISRFSQQHIDLSQIEQESKKSAFAINYWIKQAKLSKNPFKRFLQKITG